MKATRLPATCALLLAALLITASVSAEDKKPVDGPTAVFEDDLLQNLVGEWDLTREIRGEIHKNRVKVEWVLKHQFLQIHMKDVNDPPAYEALVLIGYDHSEQRYVIHWLDNFGGKFSAMGSGKRVGDSIPFVFQYPDGPFYNTFSWDAKTKTWTCLLESQDKNGKRVRFAKDTLRPRP